MNTADSTNRFSRKIAGSIGIAALVVTGLSACGPVYRTDYTLEPPDTEHGRMCIMQCAQKRSECKNELESDLKDCRHRNEMAALKLENCLAAGAAPCLDTTEPCPEPNFDQCNEEYRYCYQSCGGTVIPQVTCAGYWDWQCQ
jgi:hypothetical protein